MREILFRGKRTDNDEWAEGYLTRRPSAIQYETHYSPWFIDTPPSDPDDSGGFYNVKKETVGQFTGLTDKNGTRIFEGDIVRADSYIFSVQYGKCGGVPNAEAYGYMGFYLEAVSEGTKICVRYGLRNDICYFTDIAVIGNIHDNPELLSNEREDDKK